jgi:hypothetical protein
MEGCGGGYGPGRRAGPIPAKWPGTPPPDEAWVLRGGELDYGRTAKNDQDVFDAYGVRGICVSSVGGRTVDEISQTVRFRSDTFRLARAGELRMRGFDVLPEPRHDPPSALVVLPKPLDGEQLEALRAVFFSRPKRVNPKGKKARRW